MDDFVRNMHTKSGLLDQIVEMMARQRAPAFAPGERYAYSNTGYMLLSEVVTAVADQPFGEWMKENVFEPLQMHATQIYDDHARIVRGRAYSYADGDDGLSKAVLSYANSGATSLFTTAEDLAKLRPAFKKDGTVTAGNASGINDGAAALVLASADAAEAAGLKPRARLLGYAIAGVRHEVMGIGPIPAVSKLLEKIDMTADQFDVIESNEAFAAQACAVNAGLGLNTDKVNPNGGAIALGHPIGATGAIISIKTLYELERIGGQYGLVTMCIGGGQGIALAVERLN